MTAAKVKAHTRKGKKVRAHSRTTKSAAPMGGKAGEMHKRINSKGDREQTQAATAKGSSKNLTPRGAQMAKKLSKNGKSTLAAKKKRSSRDSF